MTDAVVAYSIGAGRLMRAPRAAPSTCCPIASTPAASSGVVVSRARLAAERSTCSIAAAETPRPTSSRQRSRTSRTSARSASCLAGAQVASFALRLALLQHDLPQQAAAQQRDPLRVGKRGRADELGDGLEVVGLGEEPQRPLAPLAQRGSWPATCQSAIALGVARGRVAPAHRRVVPRVGEVGGRATRCSARTAACAR